MILFARSVEDFVLAIGTLHVECGPLDTLFPFSWLLWLLYLFSTTSKFLFTVMCIDPRKNKYVRQPCDEICGTWLIEVIGKWCTHLQSCNHPNKKKMKKKNVITLNQHIKATWSYDKMHSCPYSVMPYTREVFTKRDSENSLILHLISWECNAYLFGHI